MTRAEYTALRRAVHAALSDYLREAAEDGRSSYGAHAIRCLSAWRAFEVARARIPRARDSVDVIRTAARRRRVIQCISDRNWRRKHAPGCLPYYQRQLRAALHPLEVAHVRFDAH